MLNNKLKDNEIIKALECCSKSSHFGECFKNQCPLVSENGCKVGEETLYPYLLDLINRLQAQNKDLSETIHNLTLEKDALFDKAEELKTEVERLNALVKTIEGLYQSINYAYDREIKEFAERLKKYIYKGGVHPTVGDEFICDIDNLLKELNGG